MNHNDCENVRHTIRNGGGGGGGGGGASKQMVKGGGVTAPHAAAEAGINP